MKFQSTLSLRRATHHNAADNYWHELFQSTLSLRRATIVAILNHHWTKFQSTLSLRRATRGCERWSGYFQFQSTLSLRRATRELPAADRLEEISIHALLAESDVQTACPGSQENNFNPRSPCGERRADHRPPWRRLPISIHALLAESDRNQSVQ